ncbi:MAG: DNA topoisomerase I, partial [Bacteroidales bacterium]
ARVEKEFDEIALGKLDWTEMIDNFYVSFHKKVKSALEQSEKKKGERILGSDPASGRSVYVKIGKFGPIAQLGDSQDDEKPRFASLLKDQLIETITLEEALELFKLPRTIGFFEEKELIAGMGKYGPYIRHDTKFYSLVRGVDDPLTIESERAIELILEKRESEKKRILKTFSENPDLLILRGKYGPYISYEKNNFRIPRKKDPESLTYDECMELIKSAGRSGTGKKRR